MKQEYMWNGPYVILEIDMDTNGILIRKGFNKSWVNIKNVISFQEKDECCDL